MSLAFKYVVEINSTPYMTPRNFTTFIGTPQTKVKKGESSNISYLQLHRKQYLDFITCKKSLA